MVRDRRARNALRSLGWSVLTFWEHDLPSEEYVIRRVKRALERKNEQNKFAATI